MKKWDILLKTIVIAICMACVFFIRLTNNDILVIQPNSICNQIYTITNEILTIKIVQEWAEKR